MKRKITVLVCLLALLSIIMIGACDINMGKASIQYDLQDGNKASTISKWVKKDGSILFDKPDDPKKTGHRFDGWFTEPSFQNEWDFETDKVAYGQTIILYAKFTQIQTNPPPQENLLMVGNFYDLQTAYDNDFITEDDLRHISYFYSGEVWEYEIEDYACEGTATQVDFTPQMDTPEINDLPDKVISDIKDAYYNFFKNIENKNSILITGYLGEYNGFYAIRVKSNEWDYPDVRRPDYYVRYKTESNSHKEIFWSMSYEPIILFGYQYSVPFSVGCINDTMRGYENIKEAVIVDSIIGVIENDFSVDIIELLSGYDQDFFVDNSLIVYTFVCATTGGSLDILNLTINQNTLMVNTSFFEGDAMALSTWAVILEVKKSDILNANKIIINTSKIT